MAATQTTRNWCEEDDHRRFEDFSDFNEWFDSDDGAEIRNTTVVSGVAQPSKAFFAGDREAYDQAFREYRLGRRHSQLNTSFIEELTTDGHWSDRNEQHFDQLVERLLAKEVVPFVGAGLSQSGGFPTWKDHLRQQGRTAGLDTLQIEGDLTSGRYEQIIQEIELTRGRPVFIQEIRDVFGRTGTIPPSVYLLAELFQDTIITTNYDRLIEQAFETGGDIRTQVFSPGTITEPPDPLMTTIIKLHGDIRTPGSCILSKNQYDDAYGAGVTDITLPIPHVLSYYFQNMNLLFLGCSLNQDRTVRVFEAIQQTVTGDLPQHFAIEACPNDEAAMVDRNEYLAHLGITPIWFEPRHYEFVEGILRLARNELRYRHAE